MCYALASVYGSNDFDSVYSRDSDYWETNGPASPTAPYMSPHQVVLQTPQEVDYGLQSTCQQDRQYEQDVGWNSSNYYTSYYWARYFDGNRPVPCSSVGPFDRLPHYRRDWWYRGLFKEGLTGAYERVGLSFFLGLIPVIGSIVCLFLSYVYVARPLSKARLRPAELLNFKVAMWKLLAVDFFMGLIFPIGPFFRAWFHCNMRIIHFAFDAKNEQEAHIDYLYYQNNGRIRVADLDKGHAFDALQMYQQYHQDCIHTLHGADLMYAVDHAILHEDLARLQCELNQARTCQIRMENERIKSCNAAQPLIKRTMSNPEAPRCYNAILPRTAWSDQGAGVGPPVFHGPKAVHNQQSVPQQEPPTVQLAAGPQEQVSDAFQPIPAPLLSVSSQPILAPQEPVAFRPVAAPPPPIARLPTNAPRQVFAPPAIPPLQAFASDQPVASHQLTSLPQAEPHRRNALAPRQAAIPRRIPIYQPMPPRRQALVLYDNAPLQYVLQPWQLTAAPRQTSPRPAFVQKRTMNRQGDLIAQKSVAPPMPAIETPIVYHQAIAAQQALSSLRERSSQGTAIPHQPLVLEQVVPEQTVVPEQIDSLFETVIARPSVALKQAIIDEHTVAPEQIVAPIDPTAGATLALVTASPMGCAVATSVRSDSIVVEAAVLSTSTIQTYIALMKQRVVQVNLSSVAPTSVVAPTSMRRKRSSTPLMLRNFGIDPPLVFATVNVSNPISTGETVPAALIQEESFSSRPIVVADQSLPSEQRNLQTRDTYCLSPIVVDISNSLLPLVDNDGLRNAQAVLPENNAQLSDDTGAREQYIVTDDPACLQIPPSQESEVTATEPEEQAIWEVQNDSEDVYGDDEADDGSSYESSDESSDGSSDESSDESSDGSSDESSGNDSEDDGEYDGEYDGRDGDKEKEEDESGDDSGGDEYDDEDDDGDDEDDDSDDEDDSGDDDGDDEFKDDPTSEEDDHIESDKEDHYQTLMRNFNIATSLNKANNRSMSSLSTLLALESSEFSESSLASRRYSGHQHCYGPSPGAISTPIFFGIRNSNGGETPALGVSAEYNAELGMETPPGVYYPQVSHSDSETSLLAKEIEKVMSTRWELEKRSVPQRFNAELCVDTD